jgi:hypothetical protein
VVDGAELGSPWPCCIDNHARTMGRAGSTSGEASRGVRLIDTVGRLFLRVRGASRLCCVTAETAARATAARRALMQSAETVSAPPDSGINAATLVVPNMLSARVGGVCARRSSKAVANLASMRAPP